MLKQGKPIWFLIYVLILNSNIVGITNLTTLQVQRIYNGTYTNWNQVGGPNLPIYVVSRTSPSGTRGTFEHYVLNAPEMLPSSLKHEVNTTDVVASTVTSTLGAIGYVDVGTATRQNLHTVLIDGAEALAANIANDRYTFWTVEHMYTKGSPSGLTKVFLDYITGGEVQGTINALYYVPISELSPDMIQSHPSPIAPGL